MKIIMRKLDIFQEKSDTYLYVASGNELSQTFVSSENNLAGIRFPVFNPRLGGHESYLLKILDDRGNILRSEVISESNMSWGGDFRFDFAPIKGSRSKKFAFSISYTGENSEDGESVLTLNQERIGIWGKYADKEKSAEIAKRYITLLYSKDDVYTGGNAYLNNDGISGDFVFQTYNQMDIKSYFSSTIAETVKKLKSDQYFLLSYFSLMLLIASVILFRIFHKKKLNE